MGGTKAFYFISIWGVWLYANSVQVENKDLSRWEWLEDCSQEQSGERYCMWMKNTIWYSFRVYIMAAYFSNILIPTCFKISKNFRNVCMLSEFRIIVVPCLLTFSWTLVHCCCSGIACVLNDIRIWKTAISFGPITIFMTGLCQVFFDLILFSFLCSNYISWLLKRFWLMFALHTSSLFFYL